MPIAPIWRPRRPPTAAEISASAMTSYSRSSTSTATVVRNGAPKRRRRKTARSASPT